MTINIGGDVTGSAITLGDNNTVTMKGVKVALPPAASVDVAAEIASLKAMLADLNSPDQGKMARALQDAEEEAQKPDPDKAEVGGAIERAIKYAQKADTFSDHIEKLAPRIGALISWLGPIGVSVAASLGITL